MNTFILLFIGFLFGVIFMLLDRDVVQPWREERNRKAWAKAREKYWELIPPPPSRKVV